ncbi:hypothetical protein C8R44DRAFT_916660 [Mycena epipterygia]|nr:hypothetical protein C8R44DRAFT_916660 [Mycena epipterygia]
MGNEELTSHSDFAQSPSDEPSYSSYQHTDSSTSRVDSRGIGREEETYQWEMHALLARGWVLRVCANATRRKNKSEDVEEVCIEGCGLAQNKKSVKKKWGTNETGQGGGGLCTPRDDAGMPGAGDGRAIRNDPRYAAFLLTESLKKSQFTSLLCGTVFAFFVSRNGCSAQGEMAFDDIQWLYTFESETVGSAKPPGGDGAGQGEPGCLHDGMNMMKICKELTGITVDDNGGIARSGTAEASDAESESDKEPSTLSRGQRRNIVACRYQGPAWEGH